MEINELGRSQISPQSSRIRQAQELARQQRSSEAGPAQGPQGQDEVTLSEKGQFLQRVYRAALEAVDVREGKVAGLQRRIAEGSYRVPLAELVERLLGADDA